MRELLQGALAIAAKDLAIEWRTKTAFVSSMTFAVLVLAVLFFARDPTTVGAVDVAPGSLWVTFTFAATFTVRSTFSDPVALGPVIRLLSGLLAMSLSVTRPSLAPTSFRVAVIVPLKSM